MHKKKVSIIVPIYNTEDYLEKCIESILEQTYDNLEIILVNDGSSDSSLNICKKYESLDSRIVIIDKKNGGLSSARNAGLDACIGEYITFVDSDDFIEKETIEHLVNTAYKYKADIVSMKYQVVDADYKVIGQCNDTDQFGITDSLSYLKGIFQRIKSCSVCDKLFAYKVWSNRRFKTGILNEDFLALSELLIDTNYRIIEINFIGYNYYTRTDSISRQGFGKSSLDAVYNSEYILKYIPENQNSLMRYAGAYAAYQARTSIAIMDKSDFIKNPQFVNRCKEIMRTNRKYLLGSFMNLKDRMFCILFPYMPRISFYLVKLIRK